MDEIIAKNKIAVFIGRIKREKYSKTHKRGKSIINKFVHVKFFLSGKVRESLRKKTKS